jgi:hypothetical protein
MLFRRATETALTYRLKWAAWEWLYSVAGCRAIGFEVTLAGPGGRIVDLAGMTPDKVLYVVEVKASRADFRRDDHNGDDKDRLIERERALERMAELTREIVERAPEDQQATLDAVLMEQRLARHTARVSGASFSTKFHDPRFLRVADYNYLMTPKGLVPKDALPPLWGLLDPTPACVIEAPRTGGSRPTYMLAAVLRAIARANTRDIMRAHGVRWEEDGAVFPRDSDGEPEAAGEQGPAPSKSLPPEEG